MSQEIQTGYMKWYGSTETHIKYLLKKFIFLMSVCVISQSQKIHMKKIVCIGRTWKESQEVATDRLGMS